LKILAKELGSGAQNVRTMLKLGSTEKLIPQRIQYNIHVMMVRCSGKGCQQDVKCRRLRRSAEDRDARRRKRRSRNFRTFAVVLF
jgi:hypothetical protein